MSTAPATPANGHPHISIIWLARCPGCGTDGYFVIDYVAKVWRFHFRYHRDPIEVPRNVGHEGSGSWGPIIEAVKQECLARQIEGWYRIEQGQIEAWR